MINLSNPRQSWASATLSATTSGGLNSSDPIIIIMAAASSKLSVFVLPRGGRVISETGREGDEEMEKQEGGGRN